MNQDVTSERAMVEASALVELTAGSVQADSARWRTSDTEPDCAETILLVEDEAFVREVMAEILHSAGYQMIVARNPAEAMRAFEQYRGEVDLLLTDVVLPGENGRALAKRLKSEDADLKVLLVTGYAEQMGLGCAGEIEEFLPKPFSTRALLQRVRQVLDRGNQEPLAEDLLRRACGNG